MWLNKILAFLKRDFANEISYRFAFFVRLSSIFTTVLVFYFISRIFGDSPPATLKEYGGKYFPFVLIGVAFSEYFNVGLQRLSDNIRYEQITGTLESVLASPITTTMVIIGLSVWDFIFTSFSVIIYFLIGIIFLGLDLSKGNILSAISILILSLPSFYSLGIISAAFTVSLKKGNPLIRFMGACCNILAGTYFPVSIMPKIIQFLSYALPITYSLKGLRLALLKGYSLKMLLSEISMLFLFGIILVPFSLWMFKLAIKKAKTDASLASY